LGPFSLGISNGKEPLWARVKGFGQGGRGFAFGPKGNLYLIKMPQYSHGCVDLYGPEGELIKGKLIDNLPYGSGGIGVDASAMVEAEISIPGKCR